MQELASSSLLDVSTSETYSLLAHPFVSKAKWKHHARDKGVLSSLDMTISLAFGITCVLLLGIILLLVCLMRFRWLANSHLRCHDDLGL